MATIENDLTSHGDIITTRLSLAVWLIDDYTKKPPIGQVSVKIGEGDVRAVRNPSGYYLFTDLVPGNYTVNIDSDFYLPSDILLDTSGLDPKKPVKEIVIKPNPAYPFPGNAILVRGLIKNADDAEVSGGTAETKTDKKGEFVLYFSDIKGKKEDITIRIKKSGKVKTVKKTIEKGKTISTGPLTFRK